MAFHSGRSIQTSNTNYPDHVTCQSYVEMQSNLVSGNLTTGGSTKLWDSRVVGRVSSDSYVELFNSTTGALQAQGSAKLRGSTILGDTATGSYLEANQSKLVGIRAGSSVKLTNESTSGNIDSRSYVELHMSKSDGIRADSSVKLTNESTSGNIASGSYVIIKDMSESKSITAAGTVTVTASKVDGLITSNKQITLQRAETGNISALGGDISIDHSTVHGNAETSKIAVLCKDSVIEGVLKCSNFSLELFNSKINQLVLSPPVESSTNSLDLALRFKTLSDSKQIQLFPNHIIVGKPPTSGHFSSHSTVSTGSLTVESYGDGGGAIINQSERGIEIDVGGFRISAASEEEITSAIQQVLTNTVPIPGQKVEPIPQTVTLRGSVVKHITFEKEGGVVILLEGASVETVTGGTIQE